MKKTIPILLAFGLIAGPAIAAETEMTCKNPRREYLAVFDDKANTFELKTPGEVTSYSVMRVDNTDKGLVIAGKTVKDGPDFVAHLGAEKRIELMDGGEIIQTDSCK